MVYKKLIFTNYRKFTKDSKMTAVEREQIDSLVAYSDNTEEIVELVDVVDESGKVLYQFYFWDYGCSRILAAGTTNEIGYTSQHSIDGCDDPDLWLALGEAYKNADPPIEQSIDFEIEDEEYFEFACDYAVSERPEVAIKYLKKAIEIDPELKEELKELEEFDSMRSMKEFKELIED